MAFLYKRQLTDREEKILLDQIMDIEKWVNGLIDGKINNCLGRLSKRRHLELINSGNLNVPATDELMADNAFSDINYKNRKDREQNQGG